MKWPQAPVVPAVHTLNLPDLEAPAAVSGALYGEREKRGHLSPWHQTVHARIPRGFTKHHEVPGFQSRRGVSKLSSLRKGVI